MREPIDDLVITRVLAPNPGPMTLEGTNTYIVGDSSGALIIDPGSDAPSHLDAIQAAAAPLGGIEAILVTHAHRDHRDGARELAIATAAPVLAVSQADDGVPFAAMMLADGDQINAGAHTLAVFLTPGHRFDHCCLWHPPSGQLFAGDLLAGRGTVVIAPPEGDMREYLASLARMRTLPLRRIWPGHGPVIDDPGTRIDQYIAHRLEREERVIDALRTAAAPRRVPDLVPMVYADTPAAMYAWAGHSLLAHLLKLAAEGRVRPVDPISGTWELI